MNIYRAIFLFLTLGFFSLSFAQNTQGNQYVVTHGDSLSCIAEKFVGFPIYGEGGSIAKIQASNTWIQNQDLIGKGRMVMLPSHDQINGYTKPSTLSAQCQNSQSRFAQDEEVERLHNKIDRLESKIDALMEQKSQPLIVEANEPVLSANTQEAFYSDRRYYLGFGLLYHRIEGQDKTNNTSARLLSDLSWQLEFGWKTPMRFNQKYFTHIHAHIQYYRYSDDVASSTVADQSILAPGVHLGVGKYFLDDKLSVEAFVGVDREFYFFTSMLNEIEFDADWIGKVGVEADYQLISNATWNFGIRPSAEFLGLGGFLNDGGWHAGGDLYVGYKKSEIRAGYVYGSMSSTNAEFDTHEVDLVYRRYF